MHRTRSRSTIRRSKKKLRQASNPDPQGSSGKAKAQAKTKRPTAVVANVVVGAVAAAGAGRWRVMSRWVVAHHKPNSKVPRKVNTRKALDQAVLRRVVNGRCRVRLVDSTATHRTTAGKVGVTGDVMAGAGVGPDPIRVAVTLPNMRTAAAGVAAAGPTTGRLHRPACPISRAIMVMNKTAPSLAPMVTHR